MIQNDNCIICGSNQDLETELGITVDGEKTTVKVCKEHADDITPKAAKAAYIKWKSERDSQMEEFLAQAAKLGMTVVPQGGLSIVNTTSKVSSTETKASVPVANALQGGREEGILSTAEVDNIMQNRIAGMSGSIGGTGVEQHSAYNPDSLADKLPEGARDGLVKMELAEGRHGTPLAIPSLRQDGLGTTRVTIARTMTDADLQKRFKQQAGADHYFVDGYDLHRCGMCKGDGQIAKSQTETIACPKCGGSGLV
jgi:DNA-directed RNA polymerase subunit RPC12/RpoP